MDLRWTRPLWLLAAGAAVFAGMSLSGAAPAHSDGITRQQAEQVLLRCRAQGLSVEQCRDRFAKTKVRSGEDHARALKTKCRLSGQRSSECDTLVSAAMRTPQTRAVNKVKAYCLRNNLKEHECQALITNKVSGGGDKMQRLLSRCTAAGLNELECKKRVDVAQQRLGQ
jgi:hypothetical protein